MIEDKKYTVYKHTAPNGKVYIGITKQKPNKRWGKDGNGYKTQTFYRAIKKYGWENISHEITGTGYAKDQACTLEKEFIKKFDTINPLKGYNKTTGGEITEFSEETRKKMSESHKGVKLSKEHILKRTLSQKGLKRSEETKKRLSKSLKGKPSIWKGKHLPEETRRKISESNKGKHLSAETRLKLSEANKGKIPWNKGIKGQIPWNKGKHLSPEMR